MHLLTQPRYPSSIDGNQIHWDIWEIGSEVAQANAKLAFLFEKKDQTLVIRFKKISGRHFCKSNMSIKLHVEELWNATDQHGASVTSLDAGCLTTSEGICELQTTTRIFHSVQFDTYLV